MNGEEKPTMKLICVILSLSILLTGCYTHTTVTEDTSLPPSTVEVSFRLCDGTHILSSEYQRVENGYMVMGKLVNKENKNSKDFSGIVPNEQIKEVVTNEFSIGLTVLGVVGGAGLIVAFWYGTAVISLAGLHN
jgi:hypothetical protein